MSGDPEDNDAPAAGTARGVEGRNLRSRPVKHTSKATGQQRDYKAVAASALSAFDAVMRKWLPAGKRECREWVARNPRRPDERPGSFSVNVVSGRWSDFAMADARGGDLISLVAYVDNCSQSEACDRLTALIGGNTRPQMRKVPTPRASSAEIDSWVAPVPLDAPPPPHVHPTRGEPSASWRYLDASGLELYRVLRFDEPDGKVVLPLSLRRKPDGVRWQFLAPPSPRPLFGLDRLAQNIAATVIVVEGEKAADAAQRILPAFVAVTSSGGANSAAKSDWSPLRERSVLIWPDADEAGAGYGSEVVRQSQKAGARSVSVLRLTDLSALRGADLPPGYDAADAEADGIDRDALAAMLVGLQSPGGCKTPEPPKQQSRRQKAQTFVLGGRYEVVDVAESSPSGPGVYWVPTFTDRDSGESTDGESEWLSGPLHVIALARNESGERWGRVLSFKDAEGRERIWTMPAAWAAGDGREMRRELLEQGLKITTDMRRRGRLLEYVMSADPGRFARSASRTGWFGDAFLLPTGEVIGNSGTEQIVMLNSRVSEGARLATSGSLENWRQLVAEPCENHSRLALALSTAFASLALGLTTLESGGLHFRGGSSVGKSTALAIAASVFGNPIGSAAYVQTWRATDNALETTAAHHSGLLLVLDELAELASEVAARTAYMLANGQGKGRSRRDGSSSTTQTWQMLFLSAGEIGLGELIAQSGGRAMAGQEVRLIDLPADAGGGFGILDSAPEDSTPGAFVDALRLGAIANHGYAARDFLGHVTSSVVEVREYLSDFVPAYASEIAGASSSGQVLRVAHRFALIGAAGKLATQFGLTGWAPDAATEAARRCFLAWLGARGTGGALEPAAILRGVRSFLELHGEARFSGPVRGDRPDMHRTMHRCGWRKRVEGGGIEYWIFPEAFRREVVAGHDHREAARVLIACGALLPASDGTPTRPERMPTGEVMRVYRVLSEKLWSAEL